jgi:hypothetical protein
LITAPRDPRSGQATCRRSSFFTPAGC